MITSYTKDEITLVTSFKGRNANKKTQKVISKLDEYYFTKNTLKNGKEKGIEVVVVTEFILPIPVGQFPFDFIYEVETCIQ